MEAAILESTKLEDAAEFVMKADSAIDVVLLLLLLCMREEFIMESSIIESVA